MIPMLLASLVSEPLYCHSLLSPPYFLFYLPLFFFFLFSFLFNLFNDCSLSSRVTLLAVSPEGKAYYWSNVLRDTSILCEERISLGEGGVATLKPLSQSNGFLLCTESANLYLVTLVENQVSTIKNRNSFPFFLQFLSFFCILFSA